MPFYLNTSNIKMNHPLKVMANLDETSPILKSQKPLYHSLHYMELIHYMGFALLVCDDFWANVESEELPKSKQR